MPYSPDFKNYAERISCFYSLQSYYTIQCNMQYANAMLILYHAIN